MLHAEEHCEHRQHQAGGERNEKYNWQDLHVRLSRQNRRLRDQDPRYFLNQEIVAGQAACVAVMFAPFIPVC